jgi:hypothetical protein
MISLWPEFALDLTTIEPMPDLFLFGIRFRPIGRGEWPRKPEAGSAGDAAGSWRQGWKGRAAACDIGLTGPTIGRSLGLPPGTGNAYPKIVLMTRRSDPDVNP